MTPTYVTKKSEPNDHTLRRQPNDFKENPFPCMLIVKSTNNIFFPLCQKLPKKH